MKPKVTWIVVADHQRARVLCNDGPGRGLHPVDSFEFETHLRASRDIMSDRPGRRYESSGGARHAVALRTDPHRAEGRRFVAHIVESLSVAVDRILSTASS